MSANLEKIAATLAEKAVTAKNANALLSPEALSMGLAGAGLGALAGATSKQDKMRKALLYGLGGGLAGAGGGAVMRIANDQHLADVAKELARTQAEAAQTKKQWIPPMAQWRLFTPRGVATM
jgi:hypothetical protein